MNVEPFGRRIYLKPEEAKTLIQSSDNKRIVRATVLAVGDECKTIKAGDTIIFTTWGIDEVDINGTTHYFLLESDEFILAKISVPSGIPSPFQALEATG